MCPVATNLPLVFSSGIHDDGISCTRILSNAESKNSESEREEMEKKKPGRKILHRPKEWLRVLLAKGGVRAVLGLWHVRKQEVKS